MSDELAEGRAEMMKYLEGVARMADAVKGRKHYGAAEAFVLDKGEWHEARALPPRYRYMEERMCFRNSYRMALRHPGLTYVEGFAWSGLLPVHHAWCTDGEGRVVDVTWQHGQRPLPAEEWVYFGVKMPDELIIAVSARSDYFGVILDFTNSCPLLKQEFDAEAALALYRDIPPRRNGRRARAEGRAG